MSQIVVCEQYISHKKRWILTMISVAMVSLMCVVVMLKVV